MCLREFVYVSHKPLFCILLIVLGRSRFSSNSGIKSIWYVRWQRIQPWVRRMLWRCRRFLCQLFQTFVRRLIRRNNISKVADETNTFCAAAPPSDTAGDFLSAGAAPSPGAAMLYSAPCYHSYSPLSCYQVRSSFPFISCSSVLVFPTSPYQMWWCGKELEKIFTNSC